MFLGRPGPRFGARGACTFMAYDGDTGDFEHLERPYY